MNVWLVAALALIVGLIPCAVVAFREPPMDRLVALEVASVIVCLILLLLAQGFHQPSFFDLALALALLSFAGGLVFARFLERWV
ncbi:MAG: monovalent cation/H+ antiporter complex subunit F [Actinomycetota bacterium]|nr:monovalent cation/H+ antiporter complex subunit F [Actinomycetota bacterium]